MLKILASHIMRCLLPPTCVLCGSASHRSIDLCTPCAFDLPWVKIACRMCANPLSATTAEKNDCGECLKKKIFYDQLNTLCYYQTPIDFLITGLKFRHRLVYANVLGELMANELSHWYAETAMPECIIPVPLHPLRLRERGYNQALELARGIARHKTIAIDYQSCQRERATDPQASTPATLRIKNVRGAFKVSSDFHARHVAVLDDVVTTGNTVNELSRALKRAGVLRVDIWCCAKTLLTQETS